MLANTYVIAEETVPITAIISVKETVLPSAITCAKEANFNVAAVAMMTVV